MKKIYPFAFNLQRGYGGMYPSNPLMQLKKVANWSKMGIHYWLPVIFWMIVIFSLSSRQRISVSDEFYMNFLFFKTLHIFEYSMLYMLIFRAIRNSWANTQVYWWAFIVTIGYAISDEFHQTIVPTREGKLRDVIIDGLGAVLSWYFLLYILPKAPKRLKLLAKSWLIIS